MSALAGKVFAVTGASSGIGRCISETVGGEGAHVFMCGRTADSLKESKAKIEASGGGATFQTFDMTDEAALRAFIDAADAHGDGLDVLVNNAGLGYIQEGIVDGNPAHWREMLDVNVYALLVGCQQAIRAMRKRGRPGRIINVSSTAAIRRESGVYGATKHAVNVITSSLREELQDDDIRVTSLMPGPFATNFGRNLSAETINGMAGMPSMPKEAWFQVLDRLHQAMNKQIGDVQVLADAVVYLVQQPINVGIEEIIIRPQKNQQF